ncbi:MAG: methylmalonyl-CoA mutase family protein, partial [Gemmatimonadota bacterium]
LEQEAEDIFAEIDELGGVVQGIEDGYFQAKIAAAARRFQDEVETGRRTIVGVNEFREDDEAEVDIEILRIDESAGELQRGRLAKLRADRDQSAVDDALDSLTAAARDGTNLMPPMLDAARAYATLGEMRSKLEDVYGRFKEPIGF